MSNVKLKEGIYWVGAIDWNIRSFHGYTTQMGSTYNAYLIIDEKITLIDTVKSNFSHELIERVSKIIDPAKIDYLISNHVEMDHSGSIPEIMKLIPNAQLVTSAPNGLKGLTAHYGSNYNYKAVKAGETLNLGARNLVFVQTPMLHWPDNMITYCSEEKILFSNDAFGQHYASNLHFDDEVNLNDAFNEASKYYANILMPFGAQVQKALEAIKPLDIEIIAPSHGIIWRSNIPEIIGKYRKWSSNENDGIALIIYDTMWHSTEKIAVKMADCFAEKGIIAKVLDLKENHMSDIMSDMLRAKYVAVGSPTLNNNMMPTVAAFLTYMKGLAPKGKIGLAFGSYGWSGQSVGDIEGILTAAGFQMPCDKLRIQYIPSPQQLETINKEIFKMLI